MSSSIIYIHGFLSSPLSAKAEITRKWLLQNRPEIEFYCPHLPPYPNETKKILENLVESLLPQTVYLMGSSLGGFWASWLTEKYALPCVIINPAVSPQNFMPKYLGADLKNYHTNDSYRLQLHHLDEIRAVDVPISLWSYYWLLVQTGDETLDYRDAVKKYAKCKQTVEEGGDHSFQGFENYLNEIIDWFERFNLRA